jgi:predicted 3-demethylubiquinone-9 3-methyltransferase (glyoxalase superfamily)
MAKLHTHLWFDSEAEEAMRFYLSIFKDGRQLRDMTAGDTKESAVRILEFEVAGHRIMAINAGPTDPFNERVTLYLETADQQETDYYWNALLAEGGEEMPCGWLKDRFGVHWQVTPEIMMRMLADPDRDKANRVLRAFYKMKRVVIADLEAAAAAA